MNKKNNKIKILQILYKNSSPLDFSVPFFWLLKNKRFDVEINILYLIPNKDRITKGSNYYINEFKELKINHYDLLSFSWIKFFGYKLFAQINSENYDKKYSLLWKVLAFLIKFFQKALEIPFYRFVSTNKILSRLSPDIILLDHRTNINHSPIRSVFKFIEKYNIKTYLTPHAPHERFEVKSYVNYNKKDYLPSNVKYLIPFRFCKYWKYHKSLSKNNFLICGYPGFNKNFINTLVSQEKKSKNKKTLNICIVSRRFLPKGSIRNDLTDDFIIDYSEMYEFFYNLNIFCNKLAYKNINLIIKPHPSNSEGDLINLLNIIKFNKNTSIELIYDPIYSVLNKIDVCISLPSTTSLITSYANIPTFLYKTNLQNIIDCNWEMLSTLYKDLTYRFSNFDDILEICDNIKTYIMPSDKLRSYYYKDSQYLNLIKDFNINSI